MAREHVRLVSQDPLPRDEAFLTRVPVPGEVVRFIFGGEDWDLEVDRVIHTPGPTGCSALVEVHRIAGRANP